MVYVVITEDKQYMKIGYTTNMEDRLRTLQSGNPIQLHLVRLLEGTVETENLIHKCINSTRVVGEWFRYDIDIIDSLHLFTDADILTYPTTNYSTKVDLVNLAKVRDKKLNAEVEDMELFTSRARNASTETLVALIDAYKIRNLRKHVLRRVKGLSKKHRRIFEEMKS